MPAPILGKAALIVVKDKRLLKVVCGIVLGIIILIMTPIVMLLGIGEIGENIDWSDSEIRSNILHDLTPEQLESAQRIETSFQMIEDEIARREVDINPIKAQVIFLFALSHLELTENLIADFISIFEYTQSIDEIFDALYIEFGVRLSAEEREGIMQIIEKALETQNVLPNAVHDEIGRLLADDDRPTRAECFIATL